MLPLEVAGVNVSLEFRVDFDHHVSEYHMWSVLIVVARNLFRVGFFSNLNSKLDVSFFFFFFFSGTAVTNAKSRVT